MPYLLDGNNLIGRARETARPSEEDCLSLVREVAERLRQTRARVILFFDGPGTGRASSLGSLTVRNAGSGSADDAIVAAIEVSRAPGEIVVVTADRTLAGRVRNAGAKCARPEEFWERFGKSRVLSAEEKSPRVDVEEWMRYFEDEKNREE